MTNGILLTFSCLLFFAMAAVGQCRFIWSPELGFGLSSFGTYDEFTDSYYSYHETNSPLLGVLAGWSGQLAVGKHWIFRPGIVISHHWQSTDYYRNNSYASNPETLSQDISLRFTTVGLPLRWGYRTGGERLQHSLQLGICPGMVVAAKAVVDWTRNGVDEGTDVTTMADYRFVDRLTFYGTARYQVEFKEKAFVALDYSYRLTNYDWPRSQPSVSLGYFLF